MCGEKGILDETKLSGIDNKEYFKMTETQRWKNSLGR